MVFGECMNGLRPTVLDDSGDGVARAFVCLRDTATHRHTHTHHVHSSNMYTQQHAFMTPHNAPGEYGANAEQHT